MIAGAKINDNIEVELSTNRKIQAKLKEIKTFGIEVEFNRKYDKLVFYPFTNIISIKKEVK